MNICNKDGGPSAALRPRLAGALGSLLLASLGSAADGVRAPVTVPAIEATCLRADRQCAAGEPASLPSTAQGTQVRPGIAATPSMSTPAKRPEADDGEPTLLPAASHAMPSVEFRDNTFARRLQGIRALSVMTLWRSRHAQVYLGLDRTGLAGLHFAQRTGSGDRSSVWQPVGGAQHAQPVQPPLTLRSVSP